MYMMSIHNVTFRYHFRILAGTDVIGESIMGGFLQVVFPFRDPMMSIHNVTFQYHFRILAGTDVIGESIMGGFLQVVFPFRDPMSGPKICLAVSTSAGVTGQFDNSLLLSTSTKVAVLGHPIITWSSRALNACR